MSRRFTVFSIFVLSLAACSPGAPSPSPSPPPPQSQSPTPQQPAPDPAAPQQTNTAPTATTVPASETAAKAAAPAATEPAPARTEPAAPPAPKFREVIVPAGTLLNVRLITPIASDTSNVLEIAVSPNPNPVVTLSSGPNLTYCNGSPPVVVTASGAQTYTWSPNISISANGDTALVGPASNVTYNVTGVDSFGCSGQATLQVQVAPTPNVNANANQDTICPGNPVNLSATVTMRAL